MPQDRTTVNTVIGSVLRGVARENKKSQQQIADAIGSNVATINRFFGGKREPSAAQFILICEACGEDARVVLDRIVTKLEMMSAVPDNVTTLKPKTPATMTDDELDVLQGAAGRDEELEHEEPETT